MIVEILNESQLKETISKNKIVIVDFYASWCGPCKMIARELDDITKKDDAIVVAKVNVDNNINLASTYAISSIPHIFIYENGEVKSSFKGFKPSVEILKILQ